MLPLLAAVPVLHQHTAPSAFADWSNLLIGLAYVAISATLGVLVYRIRRELPFHWMLVAFGAFIVACGLGHLLSVQFLGGAPTAVATAVTVLTAVSSIFTAAVLPLVVPRIVATLRAARESALMRSELEASTRAHEAKAQFMATMSHELRTPLNAIVGYTELMLAGIPDPATPDQRDYLGRVRQASDHLLRLIEDVLDFEKGMAGDLQHSPEPANAGAVIGEAARILDGLAQQKGLLLVVDAPSHANVLVDARKLRQILLNLGGNAIKFTPAGRVALAATFRDGQCVLTVADTGIGIAPEHLSRIYEPFWQADQRLTRTAGGTGLGLAVTRNLVHLMGGTITVESTLGQGTTFTVVLPAPRLEPHAAATAPRRTSRPLAVPA